MLRPQSSPRSPTQMNWTEGALARHSRRKGWDKDAARQKQYFAKARARKHEGASKRSPRASSFIPDYIPRSPRTQDQQHVSSPARQKQINPRKRLLISQRDGHRGGTASISGESASSSLGEQTAALLQAGEPPSKQENSAIDLESKRRKLLEKNDWTGVGFQKPILVDFSWQGSRNRRPAPLDLDSRPTKRQRPSGFPHKGENSRDSNGRPLNPSDQMKIRIGSQDLRWSRASNSVRSPTSQNGPLSTFDAWASQRGGSSTSCLPSRQSPSCSVPVQSISDFENLSGTGYSNPESQDRTSPTNEIEHYSRRSIERRREKRPDLPKYVVASSPPIIHQPQPTRGRRLSLFDIRSPDPEDIGSMIAQIGAPNDGPRHITKDDSKWNNWLNPDDSIAPHSYSNVEGNSQRSRSITPGVSHYWNASEDQSLPRSGCETANEGDILDNVMEPPPTTCSSTPIVPFDSIYCSIRSEQELPALTEQRTSSRLDETHTIASSTPVAVFDREGNERHAEAKHDLVLPSKPELPKAPNVQDLMDLLLEDDEGQLEEGDNLEQTSEDEDEVWKRFVFDEDCTEISREACQEAQRQTTHDLCIAMAGPPSDVAEPPSASRGNPYLDPGSMASLPLDSPGTPSKVNEHISANSASAHTTGTANSNTAHMGSPKPQHSDIKFHQPSLFIGRLASLPSANTGPVQLQPPKRRRGRPRKRRGDGRPDFRAMPDYDDDPIEECCED